MRSNTNILAGLDPHRSAASVLNDGLTMAQNFQKNKEFMQNAPLRDKLMQLSVQQQQNQADISGHNAKQAAFEAETRSKYQAALESDYYVSSDNQQGAIQNLEARAARLEAEGKDASNTRRALETAKNDWNAFKYYNSQFLQQGQQMGLGGKTSTPSGIKEAEYWLSKLNDPDPEVRKAAKYALGNSSRPLAAKTVNIGGVEYIVDPETNTASRINLEDKPITTDDVARSEAVIEGAKERARGDEQVKTQNEIADSKDERELKYKRKEQTRQWSVYNSAIENMAKARNIANTGYLTGLLPAITDGQRVVDGAEKILFNAMKPMFRGKGEGVFTDKDADWIFGMLPTRKDNNQVAAVKLQFLDDLIRSTLETDQWLNQESSPPTKPHPNATLFEDANGNRAWQMPDGTYVEIQ